MLRYLWHRIHFQVFFRVHLPLLLQAQAHLWHFLASKAGSESYEYCYNHKDLEYHTSYYKMQDQASLKKQGHSFHMLNSYLLQVISMLAQQNSQLLDLEFRIRCYLHLSQLSLAGIFWLYLKDHKPLPILQLLYIGIRWVVLVYLLKEDIYIHLSYSIYRTMRNKRHLLSSRLRLNRVCHRILSCLRFRKLSIMHRLLIKHFVEGKERKDVSFGSQCRFRFGQPSLLHSPVRRRIRQLLQIMELSDLKVSHPLQKESDGSRQLLLSVSFQQLGSIQSSSLYSFHFLPNSGKCMHFCEQTQHKQPYRCYCMSLVAC